jgi:hypothetical protein
MVLNKTTLLHLRSALIMVLKAIDAALLEAYGWTPRSSSGQLTDRIE